MSRTVQPDPAPTTRTAADLLVACLEAEGCEYVFSVPGEETMDILEAMARRDDLRAEAADPEPGGPGSVRHVTTRHEQGAAFMADVYGRLPGRAAVAMATLGPGATNLVTGVADAYLDHAPLVAITGQAAIDKLHKEGHQVVDVVGMLEPITKWNTRVQRPAAIPEIVRKAFRVAQLEKPGPTHIELSEDLAATQLPATGPGALQPLPRLRTYFPEPTDEAIEHADVRHALLESDRASGGVRIEIDGLPLNDLAVLDELDRTGLAGALVRLQTGFDHDVVASHGDVRS